VSPLVAPIRQALTAFRGGRLGAGELASWADGVLSGHLSDPARRYAFRDDAALEALSILASLGDVPDPDAEAALAMEVLEGDGFSAARLLLLDPAGVAAAPAGGAAELVAQAGLALDDGAPWAGLVAQLAGPLAEVAAALAGDDYVELLVLEAHAICSDLRLAVEGTVEVLGPGRPRIDGGLLADRLAAAAQVLRGERPFRAMVRARDGATHVVLSF
jgi:hypothetical protein